MDVYQIIQILMPSLTIKQSKNLINASQNLCVKSNSWFQLTLPEIGLKELYELIKKKAITLNDIIKSERLIQQIICTFTVKE